MKKIMAGVLAAMIMGAGTATTFTGTNVATASYMDGYVSEGYYGALRYMIFDNSYETYVAIVDFVNYENDVTKVDIPSEIEGIAVTTIDSYAFSNATNLKKVTIPKGVRYINAYAFSNCSTLTEVNLPDTLTTIDINAFERCISIEEINLPDSLTYIGQYAFDKCAELQKIVFPKGLEYINDNVCSNCKSLKEVVIENGALEIGINTFENCTALSKVYLPLSITNICNDGKGHTSFTGCDSLKDVYYDGTENQWNVLDESSRSVFGNATIHFKGEEIFENEEIPTYLTPDVNSDGSIDASDASVILAYYAYAQTGGTGTIEEFVKS